MKHLRHLTRPLVVVALLATSLVFAVASPAAGQSTIKVFEFHSADDAEWEVQITVQALGGCNPPNARSGYVTSWLGPDEEDGEVLDPGTCNYKITALSRHEDTRSQLCDTELGWGTSPGTWGSELQTSSGRGTETDISARHTGGATPRCSAQPTLAITIDPDDVVQELPASAKDANLFARAKRAVEITEFRVKVTPESNSINRTGCDQTLDFFVTGDDDETEKALSSLGAGVTCDFRITVTEAPSPFIIRDANGETFSTNDKDTDGEIELDLSEHVQLPYSRIVIIQDVANNPGNQGTAEYEISSACGGVPALPPIALGTGGTGSGIYQLPGGETVSPLQEGRWRVHSPDFANFGAGAVYAAIATSTTSDEISGCSVTVSAELEAAGCTLSGTTIRTLTWTSANPIRYFDFEFDIYCGGSRPPTPTPPPTTPPATGDPTGTTTTDTADAVPGTDTARVVARLRSEDGRIEFGLQQQQHNGSWGARVFPPARLFPTSPTVGAWQVSRGVTLSVSESAESFDEEVLVRIIARRRTDGRLEFGLQQSADGGRSWGERELPDRRYFPANPKSDIWYGSSDIILDS